jgi:ribulose kinase
VTAVGVGLYDSLDSAVKTMVRYRETFRPVAEHATLYDQLFHGVYKKMSDTLAPLNKEIQRITGYPELPGKDTT